MKIILTTKANKYALTVIIISVVVSVLTHFPEVISVFDSSRSIFPGIRFTDVATEIAYTFISLLILFSINTLLFHYDRPSAMIVWWKVLLSFLIIWVCSSALGKYFVYMHHQYDIPAIDAMVHQYLHPFRDFSITCIVTGSCYIIHLIRQKQQMVIENQQLRTESLLMQYESLKSQLNPHMLFNSLNTLRSLVREDPDRAQDYIQELSSVLRYTLQVNESQSVTVEKEMSFVESYLFMLKMRYEDNLHFNISVSPKYEEYLLPPMAVQLLIENAVKHNEISKRKPLTVFITTHNDSISVSNVLQPKITASDGYGIGLENLRKRYMLLFKKEIRISKGNDLFCVELPLISQ